VNVCTFQTGTDKVTASCWPPIREVHSSKSQSIFCLPGCYPKT